MFKARDYLRAKNGAFLMIVDLSIWRVGMPVLGAWIYGLPGLAVGISIGLALHMVVSPNFSLHPLKFKTLADQSHFVEFKRWMVPNDSKPVDEGCYLYLEANSSEHSKVQLKKLASENGYASYFDFANACLIDEQLWGRVEQDSRAKAAADKFAQE